MVRWHAVGLFALVALGGCSAVPFGEPTPQEKPAPVMLVNNASQPETFTVGVIEEDANLTIRRQSGDVYNYSPMRGSSTYVTSSENKFVDIEFPETARINGEHRLQAGERERLNVTGITPYQALVVVVYDEEDGTYRSIKSLNCGGGAITGYRVTTQAGGSEDWTMSTHGCSV
jgi:hypothetical protein